MKIQRIQRVVLFVFCIGIVSGCANKEIPNSPRSPHSPNSPHSVLRIPRLPDLHGPRIDALFISEGYGKPIALSNGTEIWVENKKGNLSYLVEGTFSREAFAKILSSSISRSSSTTSSPIDVKSTVSNEILKIFSELESVQGVGLDQIPELGYFTFELPYDPDLMAPLKNLKLPYDVVVSPVVIDPQNSGSFHAMEAEGEKLGSIDRNQSVNYGLNGLDRIHAPEFIRLAEKEIGGGVKVDGSTVRVGIADTGITLNHPNFRSKSGAERVTYMRDFTREGRVYFNPAAKFEVIIPSDSPAGSLSENLEDTLLINAEILPTPKLPLRPAGDALVELRGLKIKVSSELRQILTRPGHGAKLGILDESVFQGTDEVVNLSGEGTRTRKFLLLLVPGSSLEKDVVYFDPTGEGDFRKVPPLGDWNRTKSSVSLFAERIGFDFRQEALPSKTARGKIPLKSVSMVGFDPGRHGTHVGGIIAGSQTIRGEDGFPVTVGVAPEATLLMNRVCAVNAGCNPTLALLDLAVNGHAHVINMSLGSVNPFNDGQGVQEILINRTTSLYNVLFFVSAGNSGPGRQTVGNPSTARFAVSVGATATREMLRNQYQWPGEGRSERGTEPMDEDFMLFFSSRGPSASGGFKPNLSAPGTAMSSVSLNTANGTRGGVDVLWGTSMAAPTATGAFALLLDAIQKYNFAHPETPLPTDAIKLREVILQTARPFDVSRSDSQTQEKSEGQYTWIDEGMGMLDLSAAWKKLLELRSQPVLSAVQWEGKPIALDYEVSVSMKAPNGNEYDGTRTKASNSPSFGNGIYLDYLNSDRFYEVNISRRLPEKYFTTPNASNLLVQLASSRDEFVLKTLIYGSNRSWIKAGTLNQLDCADSPQSNLFVYGEGTTIEINESGKSKLHPFFASTLNVCIDRRIIAHDLPPGDHGALIQGYRVVKGKVEELPSFTVPVYVTVPHQMLNQSLAYETNGSVKSFSVDRNYIFIPPGTTLAKITLEVPPIKKGRDDLPLAGEICSGVELMALKGGNTLKALRSRKEAQISNCDANGSIEESKIKRTLTVNVNDPKSGIWDVSVFGSYRFPKSKYRLKVDYVTSNTSKTEIRGDLSALTGQLQLSMKEASFPIAPDSEESQFMINGLSKMQYCHVKQGETVTLSPLSSPSSAEGDLREYPTDVRKVTIRIGSSPGNDLDLAVFECSSEGSKKNSDTNCISIASSDGPTDEESVTFEPLSGKSYRIQVEGVKVKHIGRFKSIETLYFKDEKGSLAITRSGQEFNIDYIMDQSQLAKSKLLQSTLLDSGQYSIVGALTLRSKERVVLGSIPVRVFKEVNTCLKEF